MKHSTTTHKCQDSVESPIGRVYLTTSSKGLAGVSFKKPSGFKKSTAPSPLMKKSKQQMTKYFQGKLKVWDLPLDWGTQNGFYLSVRKNCAKIGYGKTMSYGQLASKSKSPRAARAVGTAMATNPISIVVPCHRVVPTGEGLLGKYGGGTDRKRWLQEMEARNS